MLAAISKIRAAISKVCNEHYGTYVGNGNWSPPNRCGACPLRAPCLKRGASPGRSLDELAEARDAFHREAAEILKGGK